MLRLTVLAILAVFLTGTAAVAQTSLGDLIEGRDGGGDDPPPAVDGEQPRDDAGGGGGAGAGGGGGAGAGGGDEPPPPPPVDTVEFYYMDGATRKGPVDAEALRELILGGTVTKKTYVWRKGMADWARAEDEPEVAAMFHRRPEDPPEPPPDNRWDEFVEGTWRSQMTYQSITVDFVTTYRRNGKFEQVMTFWGPDVFNPANRIVVNTVLARGTWEVSDLGGEKFTLTTTINYISDPSMKVDMKAKPHVCRKTGPRTMYNETNRISEDKDL